MAAPRTILAEAHERLLASEEHYGDQVAQWRRIAEAVSRRTGLRVPPSVALWVLVELHLERARYRPADLVHLREAAGYLGALAQLQAAEEAARGAAAARVAP